MSIPKGYKLVPEVATLEMKNAGWRECDRQGIEPESIEMQTIWTAMHLEAPSPPQPIYDEDADRSACRKEWKRRNEHSHFEPTPFPDYWAGWKDCAQSRAAIEVELPGFVGYQEHIVRELQAAFKASVEAAGLKVKP
jgi:hypothetical protein